MSIKSLFGLLLLLLLYLFLDKEVVLWEQKLVKGSVAIVSDGIMNFTATIQVAKPEKTESLELFDYHDTVYQWKDYVSDITQKSSNAFEITFHPRLFSPYSNNLYLLDRYKKELSVNGVTFYLNIPEQEVVDEWYRKSEERYKSKTTNPKI